MSVSAGSCSLRSDRLSLLQLASATYALCVHGQVTTIELNEPVAPEFRNILPDELFQTIEKLFRSPRHMSFHTFDMPRLLNQRELLRSAGTMGQPRT